MDIVFKKKKTLLLFILCNVYTENFIIYSG